MRAPDEPYLPFGKKATQNKYEIVLNLKREGYTYREISKHPEIKKLGNVSNQTIRDVINADELIRAGKEQDFDVALRLARRLRKANVTGLTSEDVLKAIILRLQGSDYGQISRELGKATDILAAAINSVIWEISQRINIIGPYIIHNPDSRRFARFESRDVFPSDPPELLAAIQGIISLDDTARDEQDFELRCDELIRECNQKLKRYRIKIFKRTGSQFERKSRPFAIRIKRYNK